MPAMAVLIFKLRYVPDDEAQEVRDLLSDNAIDFFETSAGVFGISMPGLWLKNNDQTEKASQLIDEYQQCRQIKAQEEYRLRQRTFMDMFKENPVRYIIIILAIILLAYIMIFSFIKF